MVDRKCFTCIALASITRIIRWRGAVVERHILFQRVGRNDLGKQRYEHMNDGQAIPEDCAAVLKYTHIRTKAFAREGLM